MIFCRRLLRVAAVTQRLPVVNVPEELLVSAVRDHVVHVRRNNNLAALKALSAERMLVQKQLGRLSPSAVISERRRGSHLFRMCARVLAAVLLSPRHQPGTTRVCTRMIREPWHLLSPPSRRSWLYHRSDHRTHLHLRSLSHIPTNEEVGWLCEKSTEKAEQLTRAACVNHGTHT